MTNEPPYLTKFQREIVWHLSRGLTVKETAREMDRVMTCVVDSLVIIRKKLDAATTTQAVLRAYVLGCVGPGPDCGTRPGYVKHLNRDEDACPACRLANARWIEKQSAPAPVLRPLTPEQVKIIRAFHCGRSHADLMQIWGVSRARLHRAVTDMYRRLGVKDVPREQRREKALEVAREQGLLHPDGPRILPPARGAVVKLTKRETAILAVVSSGASLGAASAELGISRESLSSRLSEIYRKLDVAYLPRAHKRAAALRVARARGYVV